MNDDQHHARKDNASINSAALRRIALNIVKANTDKGSNRVKFKRTGWNDNFLRSHMRKFWAVALRQGLRRLRCSSSAHTRFYSLTAQICFQFWFVNICSVVCPVLRLTAFAWAHFCSVGLRSGEYGGKYSGVWPARLTSSFVSALLWNVALSMTTTDFGGSFGIRSCSNQRLKISASTLALVSPMLNKSLPGKAPITFSPPCMPILPAKTALAAQGIAVCAGHIFGKTALVQIDGRPAKCLIYLHFLPEDTPSGGARLRVPQGFFYM